MTTKIAGSPEKLSRRRALSILGLAAAVAYTVPTALTISEAQAQPRRTFRRRTNRGFFFRRRTDRRFFGIRRRTRR